MYGCEKPRGDLNLIENRLFALLQKTDRVAIERIAQRVELQAQQVLASPAESERYVYFLTSATIALVVRDSVRPGLGLGLVGYEGAVGLHLALGAAPSIFTLLVQSPGVAWRIDGAELETLARARPAFLIAASQYIWSLAQHVAVFSAFAQVNDVKPRLARWLIESSARSRTHEMSLTQVHLAAMLGVRRASITLAAIELKTAGLLEYSRGKMRILNLHGLRAVTEPTD